MDDRGDYNSSPCTSYRRAKKALNSALSSGEAKSFLLKANDAGANSLKFSVRDPATLALDLSHSNDLSTSNEHLQLFLWRNKENIHLDH